MNTLRTTWTWRGWQAGCEIVDRGTDSLDPTTPSNAKEFGKPATRKELRLSHRTNCDGHLSGRRAQD